MKQVKATVIALLLLVGFTQVLAQALDCPALVNTALQNVENICQGTGRNQVCYGNLALEATFQAGFQNLQFSDPGDQVDLASIGTLRSTSANPTDQVWGVALMRVLANVPDTLPGQAVTMILFGGAQVDNTVPGNPAAADTEITLKNDTVLLAAPSADGQIVGAVLNGDTATALGKSADNLWLRIEMKDQDQRLGWIPASAVDSPELDTLAVIDPNSPIITPMQAFYLRPNFSGQSCADAPDGMLVQTPGDGLKIDLTVNEVHISLGSTAFLSVDTANELAINVLEGEGQIQANGASVDVPGGYRTEIALDQTGKASSAPGQPEPYDAGALDSLPTALLPEQIAPVETVWAIGQTLCVSNAGGAWLRGAPSSGNQDIVRVLAAGTAVAVSEAPQFDGTQSWWPVRTGNSTGWIEQSSLVACDQPVPPPCTPRTDWLFAYTVKPGDTLSRIAQSVGITLNELIAGNCLEQPYTLNLGMVLRVPREPITATAVPPTVQPVSSATAPPPPTKSSGRPQPPVTEEAQPSDLNSGTWTILFRRSYCNAPTVFEPPQAVNVQISSDKEIITFNDNNVLIELRRFTSNYSGWSNQYQGAASSNFDYNLHIEYITGGVEADVGVSEDCLSQPSAP